MSKRFNIELGLLSKIIATKDIATVQDRQIKPHYFSILNRPVFKYITEFYSKFGDVPTERLLLKKFPNLKLEKVGDKIDTEEPLSYWIEHIRKKKKHNTIVDAIEKSSELLMDEETENAYNVLKKLISYIETSIEENQAIDITKDSEERKKRYEERKKNKGMLGITTGFKKLDYLLKGLQKKTLLTLIAGTGVGKTWLYIIFACVACLNNYRVLFLTTEMSEEQIEDRIEAMLFGMVQGEFNYNKFKSGTLSKEQEEEYFKFLDEVKPYLEPIIIDSATSPSNAMAKVDQYKPDILFIDSVYLMEDDTGADSDWLRVAHITRDLKLGAKNKNLCVCINSQADANTSKKTGPELENISFSKAIGQDSDIVLSLFRDEQMIEDKETKIKVLKQREGTLGYVMSNWDFNTMDFSEIYSSVDDTVKENKDSDNNIIGSKAFESGV